MKVGYGIVMVLVMVALSGCSQGVTMKNIDVHLDEENAMYVDIRNMSEVYVNGTIKGFSVIPFYDVLEAEGALVRTQGWTFEPASIQDEARLRELFDEDKTIYLICRSGNRSGFLKDALDYLGYEDVVNVGGFNDYQGKNVVFP